MWEAGGRIQQTTGPQAQASGSQQQQKREEKKKDAPPKKKKRLLRMSFLSACDHSVSETRQYYDSTIVTGMRLSVIVV